MIGEGQDSTKPNRLTDEEVALRSKIPNFRDEPQLHARLTAKLAEYGRRNEQYAYMAPQLRYLIQGEDMYLEIFKPAILSVVLELAEDTTRDFEANPVLLPEVADEIMRLHPIYDLAVAKATPLIDDPNFEGEYVPDFATLSQTDSINFSFAHSYAVILAYASDREEILERRRY